MFIYATYNHNIDFEHIITIKVQLFLGHRVLGHSLVDKKVFYLYKEVFHHLTIQLGYVQSSSYLTED